MEIVTKKYPRLYTSGVLDAFLEIAPQDPNALQKARQQIEGRNYPRAEIAAILHSYNKAIGNDATALLNIEKLKSSECVITGQQLGLMGGPAYTILKAITCLLLARQAQAIPIFWLATEDHDVFEINHTYLIDAIGNLKEYRLNFPKDHFVEDLTLNAKHVEILSDFMQETHLSLAVTEGASYAKVMAAFLAKLFEGTGLIFLEPYLLRPLAQSFFQREICDADAITKILHSTTERFAAAGGEPLLHSQEGTNLFLKVDGFRRKIQRKDKGFAVGDQFFTESQLLKMIETEPQRFSPNVAARPLLQSLLFPTIAYVAGPNELGYYHQLRDYHQFHEVAMPWIVPRLSATLLMPYAADLLEKCKLDPWNEIPAHWHEVFPHLDEGFAHLIEEWQGSALKTFGADADEEMLRRCVRQSAQKIRKRICKARLSKQDIPYYALHFLRNLIHPHGKLQERVLNWLTFQAHFRGNLIDEFLQKADWQTSGHLYCYL